MQHAGETNKPLSMLLIDLDWFEQINYQFGHLIGDHLLSRVAKVMNPHIQDPQIVVLHGGEDFIIFMPETILDEVLSIAETIRGTVKELSILEQRKVTISIGAAQWLQQESLAS